MTGEQADKLITLIERIAVSLEAIVQQAFDVELNPPQLSAEEQKSLEERDDNQAFVDEETAAVVEMIEESGRQISLSVYERLGIDPPDQRERAPDENVFDEPQPGARTIDDEIRAYKKRTNEEK